MAGRRRGSAASWRTAPSALGQPGGAAGAQRRARTLFVLAGPAVRVLVRAARRGYRRRAAAAAGESHLRRDGQHRDPGRDRTGAEPALGERRGEPHIRAAARPWGVPRHMRRRRRLRDPCAGDDSDAVTVQQLRHAGDGPPAPESHARHRGRARLLLEPHRRPARDVAVQPRAASNPGLEHVGHLGSRRQVGLGHRRAWGITWTTWPRTSSTRSPPGTGGAGRFPPEAH